MLEFISIVGFSFSGIGIFISLFSLIKIKFRDDGYMMLYLIMLLLGIELVYKTFLHSRLIIEFPFLFKPGRYYNLLVYPLFLLFIWSSSNAIKVGKKYVLVIVAPFVAHSLFQICFWLIIDIDSKIRMIDLLYQDNRPGPFNYWSIPGTLIKGYIIPSLFLVLSSLGLVKVVNSGLKPNRRLVQFLFSIFFFYLIFIPVSNFFYKWLFEKTEVSFIEWPVDILFTSIIISLLSSVALLVNSGTLLFPPLKYEKSSLTPERSMEILQTVKAIIEEEKLYLDSEFSATALSKKVGINRKYISQAINHQMGVSFVDFINKYRVQHAKTELNNPVNNLLKLEAIGNLVGFKSKSAFYAAFKKHTGETPSQFIKKDK